MEIKFNATFKDLLDKYNLPSNLSLNIELPKKAQKKIQDKIIMNENGIGLENSWIPSSCGNSHKQSFYEDQENHFHVDFLIDDVNTQQSFEYGIKILVELANRFQKEKIDNVQLTYSFMSPEMAKLQALENNIEDDEFFISDRLSFHTKRPGQLVVNDSLFNDKYCAFLIIDI